MANLDYGWATKREFWSVFWRDPDIIGMQVLNNFPDEEKAFDLFVARDTEKNGEIAAYACFHAGDSREKGEVDGWFVKLKVHPEYRKDLQFAEKFHDLAVGAFFEKKPEVHKIFGKARHEGQRYEFETVKAPEIERQRKKYLRRQAALVRWYKMLGWKAKGPVEAAEISIHRNDFAHRRR